MCNEAFIVAWNSQKALRDHQVINKSRPGESAKLFFQRIFLGFFKEYVGVNE